jgi:hypothetical protein
LFLGILNKPSKKLPPAANSAVPGKGGDVGKDAIAVFGGEPVLISELTKVAIANSLKKLPIFTQGLGEGDGLLDATAAAKVGADLKTKGIA